MNDILGLVDAIEAMILDAARVPLSNKVMIDQERLVALIDKLRHLINDRDAARKAVDLSAAVNEEPTAATETADPINANTVDILIQAKREAKRIQSDTNDYSDNILAQLQLLITKLQKNLIRLEKNIEDGRSVLEEKQKKLSVSHLERETNETG